MATVKSFKADYSSVSPSSERTEESCVLCVFICRLRPSDSWLKEDQERIGITKIERVSATAHEDHHEYTKGSNFSSALPIHFLYSSLIHTSNFKAFTLRLSCRSYAVLEFSTECDFSLFARWPS